jgi:hypothetical protein
VGELSAQQSSMSNTAWHFTHGHSGKIENLDSVYDVQAKGWGLSFHQLAGSENYVHFAVPSNSLYGWRVDFLHLQFTCGENAKVTEVHLWDGRYKFRDGLLDYQEGEVDVLIDLGQEWEIQRALGVTLKLETSDTGDAHFMFHAVGANFRI